MLSWVLIRESKMKIAVILFLNFVQQGQPGYKIEVYSGGNVVKTYVSNQLPKRWEGDLIYFRDRVTGKIVYVCGTYTIEET